MITGFKEIFQVKTLHSYFNQNVCKCLVYTPTESTKEIMQRSGLSIRQKADGFIFYANTKDSLNNFLKYVEMVSGESTFEFEIQSEIDNFNIITDFPVDWSGTVSFNTNNKSNTFNDGALDVKEDYSMKKNLGSLARLTINFKDILKYAQETVSPKFQIKFKARSTQWQYYVINKSAINLDNPKISSKTDITFTGPIKTTIATGSEAIMFTSGNQLIPLSEMPNYKFSLINEMVTADNEVKSKTSSKVIFNALPNPNSGIAGFKINTDTKLVSSPMYVYI